MSLPPKRVAASLNTHVAIHFSPAHNTPNPRRVRIPAARPFQPVRGSLDDVKQKASMFLPKLKDVGRAKTMLNVPLIGSSNASTKFFTQPRRSDRFFTFMAASTLTSASVYYWTNRELVFLNKRDRIRFMNVSWETERILGEELRAELDDEGHAQFGPILPPSDIRRQEIERIVERILKAAEEDFFEIRGRLNWKVYVRDNPESNATCQIGGNITCYTGLFKLLVEAETRGAIRSARDGLAGVLAHEIAHGLCRHSSEQLAWFMLPFETVVKFIVQDSMIMTNLLLLLVDLPFSRECELEADAVGLELMARAGYNPEAMISTFSVLASAPDFAEFISTHPGRRHRIANIEKYLPDSIQMYQSNKNRFRRQMSDSSLLWQLLCWFSGKQRMSENLPLSTVEREREKELKTVKSTVDEFKPKGVLTKLWQHRSRIGTLDEQPPPSVRRFSEEEDSLA